MTKIVIENLYKNIKEIQIIKGIQLEMTSGNIYGIRGKNGSGKTMLMRLICGLILPSEGHVYIDDLEIGKDISFPKSVGILIEKPGFIENETVMNNLKLLSSIKNIVTDEQIISWLNRLQLLEVKDKKFKKLSLGMKQKVGIIAAVMETPDIIILDEPFNALDESSVEVVKEILIESKARGALCILTCHDTDELKMLSDEIFYLKEGRISYESH